MKATPCLSCAIVFGLLALGGRAQPAPAAGAATAAAASGWKMDLSQELALWHAQPVAIDLATFHERLPLGARIDLKLVPNGSFPLPVALRSPPKEDTFGGTPVFTVPADGLYRISAGSPVWIEVADQNAGVAVHSPRYEMQMHSEIRKCVLFPLRAGVPYVLQLSGSVKAEVSVLLTADRP